MHKYYMTFGQDHVHKIYGKTCDENSVVVITAENNLDARAKAFELTGGKFSMLYSNLDDLRVEFFSRGLFEIEAQ